MSEVTYRKVTDDDFTEDGKGKPELKFYESEDGVKPNDPTKPFTEPTKENKEKYVVEVTATATDGAADGGPVAEESSAAAADADADADADAAAAAAAAADADAAADREKSTALAEPKGSVNEALANLIYDELRQVIHLNLDKGSNNKPSEATIDAAIQKFEKDSEKNKKLPEHKVTSILQANNVNPGGGTLAKDGQDGGRRRSKRRQPRRSAKQSKKGGRSRKNHRKQSRRRKH